MAQVDMPKNSINSTPAAEPKKKLEKVVHGKVNVKEQSDIQKIANDFLAEDLKTVKNRILVDYLIPMVKNGVWSVINSAISIALFGEDRSRGSSNSYGSRTQQNSYDRYYQGGQNRQQNTNQPPIRRSINNVDFEFRGDADDTLFQLKDAIRRYGQTSIGDMWDLMGVTPDNTDYNYGWYSLDDAYIRTVAGGYRLVLPRPTEPIKERIDIL